MVAVVERRCDLVLAGPGFAGALHVAGAVAELLDAGYAPQRVAGVSGGAIVAALVVAGYDGDALRGLLATIDFPSLARNPRQAEAWLDGLLGSRGVRTFRDLAQDDRGSSPDATPWRLLVAAGDVGAGELIHLPADVAAFGRDPESLGVADAVLSALGYAASPESSSADLGELEPVDGFADAHGLVSVFDRTDGRPGRWPTIGIASGLTRLGIAPKPWPKRWVVLHAPTGVAESDTELSNAARGELWEFGRAAIQRYVTGAPEPVAAAADQPTPPPPARRLAQARYANDTAFGPDQLDVEADVESLCTVVMAERVEPPLSIGLFGDWGTGKTFFMQKMRETVDRIAADSLRARNAGERSDFCENVRQITFNAWHYIDANLWASLVTTIFDGLLGDSDDPRPLSQAERRRRDARARTVLSQLRTSQALAADARARRDAAEEKLSRTRDGRDGARVERRDVTDAAKTDPRVIEAARILDHGETGDHVGADVVDLVRTASSTAAALGVLWRQLGRTFQIAVAVMLGVVGAAVVLSVTNPGVLAVVGSWAGVTLAAVGTAVTYAPKLRTVKAAADVVNDLYAKSTARTAAEIAALQAEIATAERDIADIESGRRVVGYIEQRAASADYRQHLGLVATIRKDLARLSDLMSGEDADGDVERVDRIVLYVDDLDRCPADRVVEVLQAVHLLLAFPLFVVVVGVDARWLRRSLELAYRDVVGGTSEDTDDPAEALHWAATPQNYLDKIFQIPFSLRPLDGGGFSRLVRSIVTVAPDRQVTISDEVGASDSVDGMRETVPSAEQAARSERVDEPSTARGAGDVPEAERPPVPTARVVAEGPVAEGRVVSVALDRDGRELLVSTASGLLRCDARTLGRRGWDAARAAAMLAPDASHAVLSTPDGKRLQPLDDAGPGAEIGPGSGPVALASGGRFVVTSGAALVYVTDTAVGETWSLSAELSDVLDGTVSAAAASTAGSTVALADAAGVVVRRDDATARIFAQGVTAIAISDDGAFVAYASGLDVMVADSGLGVVGRSTALGLVTALAFGRNSDTLVGGTRDGRAVIWSFATTGALLADSLDLTAAEVAFVEGLHPLVRTPRGAKRLVNTYRILRARLDAADLDRLVTTDHPVVLVLLALVTGFPQHGGALAEQLLTDPAPSWPAHVKRCAAGETDAVASAGWALVIDRLADVESDALPEDIAPYVAWAPRVARFSFEAGRAAAALAR